MLIAVFPFVYLVLQSLAPWDEVNRLWIPTSLTLRSYSWLFFEGGANDPWLRALLNSFIVTLGSATLMVVSAGMMGYALAQVRFRGRALLDNVILFQMFFPAIILLVPSFLVVRSLGLYNTYFAMILPKAVSVWAIFMYASFFQVDQQRRHRRRAHRRRVGTANCLPDRRTLFRCPSRPSSRSFCLWSAGANCSGTCSSSAVSR